MTRTASVSKQISLCVSIFEARDKYRILQLVSLSMVATWAYIPQSSALLVRSNDTIFVVQMRFKSGITWMLAKNMFCIDKTLK